MTSLQQHTVDSAPDKSKERLETAKKNMGFVPNLLATLAESPTALQAYLELDGIFSDGSLSDTETQIVLLTASFENKCDYCMAAHSTIAGMKKIDETLIEALRENKPLDDKKLSALRTFTRAVVTQRGFVKADQVNAFLDAGYKKSHILEVITGVALKTISNYTNHVAETPVDDAFAEQKWVHPEDR